MRVSKRFCVYFTVTAWLIVSVAALFIGENSAWAQTTSKPATTTSKPVTAAPSRSGAVSSFPPDTKNYQRRVLPADRAFNKGLKQLKRPGSAFVTSGAATLPGILVVDPNSVNFNGYSEPSIGIDPSNPNLVDIHGGFGGWNGNVDLFHSNDGGFTWTRTTPINAPPNNNFECPCDTAIDWGFSRLAGAFLSQDATNAMIAPNSVNIYSGTTSDPTVSANFTWNASGIPLATQLTNHGDAASINNADQPWLLVNRTTASASSQNVYVGYDDFSAGPDMRVAVAQLPANGVLNFTVDNKSGTSGGGGINPGHRLAVDPRTGFVYSLFEFNAGGGSGSARPNYIINRSTDNGATWTLNGNAGGVTVATADSDQPAPKFGTVNCLLGGVDHAAVDPVTGDVYVVYGNRNSGTGNNRLAIRRLTDNGAGGVNIGGEHFVNGQVQSALPSVAVAQNGAVGVLYDTFDGFSPAPNNLPIFTAHLAISMDQGVTFSDQTVLTFLSTAVNDGQSCGNGLSNQRVLGDYQQMKAVGNTFYGVFSGNGAALGRASATIDPIFFRASVGADLAITKTAPATVVAGTTLTYSLNVTNNGTADATSTVVTDPLPTGTTFVSSTVFPCTGAPLTCNLGTLAGGASTSFSITINIPANFLSSMGVSSKTISNTASVSFSQPDSTPGDNTATANTLVTESADLLLAKTCGPTPFARTDHPAFCDIQVTNLGLSDAQNVVLNDAIVSGVKFTVTAVSGAACAPATPIGPTTATALACNLGTLAAGVVQTTHVVFTTKTAGTINDTATVTSTTPDPNGGNNSATGSVNFHSRGLRP